MVETKSLCLNDLRTVNVDRCERAFAHKLSDWSNSDWGVATVGEAGEALNVVKKLNRVRDGLGHMNKEGEADLKQQLADEMADVAIYLDLWAASQGIDLAQAIVNKFNRDSAKHGVEHKL